jgi:hypothetical protein
MSDGSVGVALPGGTYRVKAGPDDGAVSAPVPRDEASRHVVSAHSSDEKVTVRTAN